MRLVFVLLEKLGESFFELDDEPSIGGNERLRKTRLTKNHNPYLTSNLWEN